MQLGVQLPYGTIWVPGTEYREQDSASTLSTGQSCHSATFNPATEGNLETYEKGGKDLVGNGDAAAGCRIGHQIQMGYSQSLQACISYDSNPYFGRKAAPTYEPNAAEPVMGLGIAAAATARVMLPLDVMEGTPPIYVNAKQYYAILRRRQNRAKLEAQNKIAKPRKPYLHESRHLHALRRARGSRGRFLNTKNLQLSSNACHGKHLEMAINGDVPAAASQTQSQNWNSSHVSCVFTDEGILERAFNYGCHRGTR